MTVDRLELTPSLSTQYHIPSCLRVAIEAHVEETLREAGKPLNVVEIAKSSGIDPSKLGKSLSQLWANRCCDVSGHEPDRLLILLVDSSNPSLPRPLPHLQGS